MLSAEINISNNVMRQNLQNPVFKHSTDVSVHELCDISYADRVSQQ